MAHAGDKVPRRTGSQVHFQGCSCAREAGKAALQLRGWQGEVDAAEAGRGPVPARAAGSLGAAAAVIAVLVVIRSVPVPAILTGAVSAQLHQQQRSMPQQGSARTPRCRRRQRRGRPCCPGRRPAPRPAPHRRPQAARKQPPPHPHPASAAKLLRPQRLSRPHSHRPGISFQGI